MKDSRLNLVLKPEVAAIYVSLAELARQFNMSYQTLYMRYVSKGKLKPTRFGKHCYFNRADMPLLVQLGTAPIYKGGPRK